MSCQILTFARFEDLKSVRKYLFPEEKPTSSSDDLRGWDDHDWGWKEDDNKEEHESDLLSWLQESCVSISPTSDIVAIGNGDRLAILSQKYSDDEESSLRYSVTFENAVLQEDKETITSLLCVPLASQKRSTQGGPDWTSIIVGTSSGYIRIYTENGTLLLSQIFSEEPVVQVKCQTYTPARFLGGAEKHEELVILYKNSLVSLDGFSLFQSLRACRNQVARAAASGSDLIPPPPLSYKKWALTDQEMATDIVVCGGVTPNPFDQMQIGSMIGGFNARVTRAPPAQHLYVATGKNSFLSFFYIVDGSVQPMLSDVAHAVASKLKSAFVNAASGWFGFSKNPGEAAKEKKKKIEPATSITSRFGLPDKRRQGEVISLSPNSRLAATSDSFGRVMLIDINCGIVIRMWKGYRDAQIGWIESREEVPVDADSKAPLRRAMFLIIYAPRRGILEVWTAELGARVAAFSTSRWCRLLCPSYGMLGLNSVTCRTVPPPPHAVYLLDPDGAIQTLEVPFHLALSDKNSKRARDVHLLKKLKTLLKEHTGADVGVLQGDVIDLLLDIRTVSIRQQGLERIVSTKSLSTSFLLTVLKAVINQLYVQQENAQGVEGEEGEGVTELDYESRSLLQTSQVRLMLLETYSSIHKLNSIPSNPLSQSQDQEDEQDQSKTLLDLLSLHETEMEQVLDFLKNYSKSVEQTERHAKFVDNPMSPQEFLLCFDIEAATSSSHQLQRDVGSVAVKLHKKLSDKNLLKLGSFLFDHVIQFGFDSSYHAILQKGHIQAADLMKVLLELWLSSDAVQVAHIESIHGLVRAITALADPVLVEIDDLNDESPWWQVVRQFLQQAQHVAAALLLALVARSIALEPEKAAKPPMEPSAEGPGSDTAPDGEGDCDSSTDVSGGWESVSLERARWSMLVKQLEDLVVLQTLLNTCPPSALTHRPPWESQPVQVTVSKVMAGGRGVLAEVLAKWICGHGISPTTLCLNSVQSNDEASSNQNLVFSGLQGVQARLPHSLDPDILMANSSWEYMVLWYKDPEVILPLELSLSFMKCIQNTVLQRGVCLMIWKAFLCKKLQPAAVLVEKVGKCPKDRLCRREVGLSEISLEKFLSHTADLLECIIQCAEHSGEVPVYHTEDAWHEIPQQQSLVSLALEHQEINHGLVRHHHTLTTLLHAVMVFSLRGVKPLSLYDTKGKTALFKPLHTYPPLSTTIDQAIINERFKLLCNIIRHSIQELDDIPARAQSLRSASISSSFLPHDAIMHRFIHWPEVVMKLAECLFVNVDDVRRFHCLELYTCGFDQLGQEILSAVNDRVHVGSQLTQLAGKRLNYFVFETKPEDSLNKLALSSTKLSTWLRNLNPSSLRCASPPLSDTRTLLSHIVNTVREGDLEYSLVIEMIDFIQNFD